MKNIVIVLLAAAVVVLLGLLARRPAPAVERVVPPPQEASKVEAPAAPPSPAIAEDRAQVVAAPTPSPKAASTEADAMCRTLLDASVAGDFAVFKRVCEEKGDANMRMVASDPSTEETFRRASAVIAPPCKGGYELVPLGSLLQRGHTVHLWRLKPSSGDDEFLVRLTLKNKRLAGFFFQ